MKQSTAYASRSEAENILRWAERENPGPWVEHSMVVGRAADNIAFYCNLDSDIAYVLGLLHDIGRYEGVRDLHHIVAGHDLMQSTTTMQGFVLRTHSQFKTFMLIAERTLIVPNPS